MNGRKRKPKSLKAPGRLRVVLAANLRARMLERYPLTKDRVSELSKASGVSRSTVQRMVGVSPVIGASIDTIEAVARALQAPVPELLTKPKR